MARVRMAVLAFVVVVLLAGCAHPAPRDPASDPIPAGKGAMLANAVTHDDRQDRVSGVSIVVSPAGGYAVTDNLGHAVVNGLRPGHYTAQASKSGFEAAPVPFDVTSGNYTEIVLFMEPLSN